MKKRGQVIPTAATFVLLFLLFMLGYILLLPVEERTDLLGGEFGEEDGDLLLNENPGFVGPRGGITEINLFDIHLFSEVDTEISNVLGSLRVSKNVFFGEDKNISFNLRDLGKLEKVNLLYSVVESKGNLIISLNGYEIYNGEGNQNYLELNNDYLKEKNVLVFSCSGFVCKQDLRNLKIVKSYIVDNREDERVFSLSKKSLKSASLNYYLDCIGDERGDLKINLNGKGLFGGRVICNDYFESDVPLGYLEDENKLKFELSKGDIVVEDIVIIAETGGSRLLYFFEVDDIGEIEDGELDVVLEMLFDEYRNYDWLKVYINDEMFNFKVKDFDYLVISDYVKEGRNSLSLRALDNFEIVDLTVRLE